MPTPKELGLKGSGLAIIAIGTAATQQSPLEGVIVVAVGLAVYLAGHFFEKELL